MARHRQLPAFLAKVSVKRNVPTNAILVVAVLSVAVGGYMSFRPDGIGLLVSFVNFGALTAFLALHVAVVVHYIGRRRSRNVFAHLVMPAVGFAVLAYVVVNANVAAQRLGFVWLGLGLVVLIVLYASGRRPTLPPPDGAQEVPCPRDGGATEASGAASWRSGVRS